MHEQVVAHGVTLSTLIGHGIFAFFGAIVHASQAHRTGKSKTLLDFVLLTLMSSFSGAMFALLGFQFFQDHVYLTMAMAGTGGYLGVEGMSIVINRITAILNKK